MFTSIKRIIHSGWENFLRNIGLSVATCFIMVLTILLITSLFLLQKPIDYLIVSLQEKADISVYFKEDALEQDILKVKEELVKIPEVKDVEYISKEKALEKFIKKHKDDPDLTKSLALFENPLPAHLNIKAFEAGQYLAVVNFLETSPFEDLIDNIDYSKRKLLIDRIFSITAGVNKAGIISSLVLVVLAILVAFNTIRLAIYNSREEIKIQRLVGASNWFIQGPFLVQGAMVGTISTLIALLITFGACYFLSPKIEIIFPGLNIFGYFTSNFWTIVLIQLTTGIGLGVISSTIAIRRYLRV